MPLQPAEVRSWAKKAKIQTAERGRLPRATISAYLHAHPALARGLAMDLGVEVASRGPVSVKACDQVAELL